MRHPLPGSTDEYAKKALADFQATDQHCIFCQAPLPAGAGNRGMAVTPGSHIDLYVMCDECVESDLIANIAIAADKILEKTNGVI